MSVILPHKHGSLISIKCYDRIDVVSLSSLHSNDFHQFSMFHELHLNLTFRYDGQRAQIHLLLDGTVRIFSRNGDETTSRFPDLVDVIKQFACPTAETFMLDAEVGELFILFSVCIFLCRFQNQPVTVLMESLGHTWCIYFLWIQVVATDRKNGNKLMSFQELSTRERGSKDALITTKSIKVFNNDIATTLFLQLNDYQLYQEFLQLHRFVIDRFLPIVLCCTHLFDLMFLKLGHGCGLLNATLCSPIEC